MGHRTSLKGCHQLAVGFLAGLCGQLVAVSRDHMETSASSSSLGDQALAGARAADQQDGEGIPAR